MLLTKMLVLASSAPYGNRQILTASDAATQAYFGWSSALSSDGTTLIIGAFGVAQSSLTQVGAAYVFTRSGATWTQQAKLTTSDPAQVDAYFGISVALSDDGNTALIGAYGRQVSTINTGAAYVFTRSGSTWSEQTRLSASDGDSGDQFGYSVALSSDGNTALIGARYEATSPNTYNGAAYAFTRSGSTWTEQAKLLASDRATGDEFGKAVALSSDGNTALIGAQFESDSGTTYNGAAYVFTRSGSTWTQQAKLLASDKASNDRFGFAVALSSSGDTAAIGVPYEETSPDIDKGSVYIFTRSGSSWTQNQKISSPLSGSGGNFGYSIGMSGSGTKLIVGAPTYNTNTGSAYVYTNSTGTWQIYSRLQGPSGFSPDNGFGLGVSISRTTGSVAAVGAAYFSSNTGRVYAYS